ncbi:MAG: outer membrane beta-barrel protein [Gammaproteobacteria bacterium]
MAKGLLKILLTATTAAVAFNTYAVGPGFYMGVMTGPATNNGGTVYVQPAPGSTTLVQANPRSNQWGSSIYLGNKINQYASIEGGINYFSTIQYSTKNNVQTCSGLSVRNRDLHIVGKGEFPLSDFSIFGKAGVAVVYQTVSGGFNTGINGQCGKNQYTNKFSPTFSIGAGYDLSQSWVADVSWTRILVGGQSSSVDFLGFGISYHFTDRYCGQFLCD